MNGEATDRLPVVFLHGIRVSGTMWRPIMQRVGTHRPVAAPDLPGHGQRRGEPFTMEAAVATVVDAIDQLGGKALVVGLSMGGYVGMAVAGSHPHRVAGLVAIGCTAKPGGPFAAIYGLAAGLAGRHPDTANRLTAWGFRQALPAPVAEAVVAGGLACEIMPQVVDAVTAMNPPTPLLTYPGPVWLLNAARDPFRRHERVFLRACRNGRLSVWPARNHVSLLAETAILTRLILDAAVVTEATPPAPAA
jgi:pimeloyl-ACP methyl ester carboxylesterase